MKKRRSPKKSIDSFVDLKSEKAWAPPAEIIKLCECGKAAHGDNHQCWSCMHRA